MYEKKLIRLRTPPSVLEDDIKSSYRVRPSSSIYYGKFPYKISFDTVTVNDLIPDNSCLSHFNHDLTFEFQDFARNFYDNYKFICNSKRKVYLSNKQDFEATLAMYGDWVDEIQGPVSEEHLELLYSSDLHLECKTKPWYNKYNYKLELWASYFVIRNLWLTNGNGSPQSKAQWKDKMEDDLIDFVETIEAQDYDARIKHSKYDYYNGATMFFKDNDFQEIMAFKTLIIPDYKTKVTKVIL